MLLVRALTVERSLRDRAHSRVFAIEDSDLRLELSRRFRTALLGSDRRAFPSRDDRGDLTGGLLAPHLHSAAAVTNDLPDARRLRRRAHGERELDNTTKATRAIFMSLFLNRLIPYFRYRLQPVSYRFKLAPGRGSKRSMANVRDGSNSALQCASQSVPHLAPKTDWERVASCELREQRAG